MGARAGACLQLGTGAGLNEIDLAVTPLRDLNAALHRPDPDPLWRVLNPRGVQVAQRGHCQIDLDQTGARSQL